MGRTGNWRSFSHGQLRVALWSSFHIKNTISWICHSIPCICHSLMCSCHSIMCIFVIHWCVFVVQLLYVYLPFSCVYLSFSCVHLSFNYVYLPFGCVDLPFNCVYSMSHFIMCWLFSCVRLSFMQLCFSILHSIMACCLSIIQYRSNIDWRLIPKQQKHRWISQAGRTGHGAVPHKMAAAWPCVVKKRFTRHLRLQRQ